MLQRSEKSSKVPLNHQPTIAILGAGAAGLCMGMRLKQLSIESFTIYEKSDRVGGTWRENTYPGAGCDVPSHLYSFSFEPKFDWSRVYSRQPEIQRYLEHCAQKYDLHRHVRFGFEVANASFDEAAGIWRLRTTSGEEFTAQVLITGTGQLNRPHTPEIPGLEEFGGAQFHSARWNHQHDLAGRNVAVIGNAASAIQFIPPVAEVAKKVHVFQRHANWIIPRNDRAYRTWERFAFQYAPGYARLMRALIYWKCESRFFVLFRKSWVAWYLKWCATRYLESHIQDPALRKTLTPDFTPGCKRTLISDDYYQALARPNVEVVTNGIARITRDGIITNDGTLHAADTLVFATGFEATRFLAPIEITGREGRQLADVWKHGAEAYLGVAVSGFPNLFLLYGPNTNLGHNSIIFMIECQVNYILQCLSRLQSQRLATLEVKPEVQDSYNRELQRGLAKTAWYAGCSSWYKTKAGKVTNNWSGFASQYWWRMRRPDPNAFHAAPEVT
ncbi:4-hydroxyacetophenone monooxygenase [Anatilimnocola aggregata]|uniref:4-hydroxyacetophenone monooxygenase n=2 Tax=Anatilimnocola aggregata TaxID=2528021 RepID=A0A517YMG4_9BACT|nr:4-hydroxyacetophenone monooxygenase [Anatilimnocola aggregata]